MMRALTILPNAAEHCTLKRAWSRRPHRRPIGIHVAMLRYL